MAGSAESAHDIPESREREPEEEDELEDVVEGEPVDNLDEALKHGEEGENDPILKNELAATRDQCATGSIQESSASRVKEATYSQPLSVILLVGSEESGQGVVAGNDETSKVGQELAAQVEDDEEKVESANADGGVGLGDARRLLEVVKGGVLGELSGQKRQHPRLAQSVIVGIAMKLTSRSS